MAEPMSAEHLAALAFEHPALGLVQHVLDVQAELDRRDAVLKQVIEAWWAGAEGGDAELIYPNPEETLDTIWDAIKDVPGATVATPEPQPQPSTPEPQPQPSTPEPQPQPSTPDRPWGWGRVLRALGIGDDRG